MKYTVELAYINEYCVSIVAMIVKNIILSLKMDYSSLSFVLKQMQDVSFKQCDIFFEIQKQQ